MPDRGELPWPLEIRIDGTTLGTPLGGESALWVCDIGAKLMKPVMTPGRADVDVSPLGYVLYGLTIADGVIYFTDRNLNRIGSVNTDGTQLQTIASGLGPIGGVAITDITTDGGSLYWIYQATGQIGQMNLDGSGELDKQWFLGGATINNLQGICIDPALENLYVTDLNSGISKISLSTALATLVIPYSGGIWEHIRVDATHIYWTIDNRYIGRANLDGSGVNKTWFDYLSTAVHGLELDPYCIYYNGGNTTNSMFLGTEASRWAANVGPGPSQFRSLAIEG